MKNASKPNLYRGFPDPFPSLCLSKRRTYSRLVLLHAVVLTCTALLVSACQAPAPQPPQRREPVLYGNLLPEATQIIQSALAGPDPRFQVNAIEVVATTGQVTLVPAVQRLMKSPEARVRFAAASAVGDLRYSLAQRDVAELLGDNDQNVRLAAAYAMARLGSAENFDVLLKAVTSTDQVVRGNAVMLLGRAGDKRAIKALWWALSRDDSDHGVTLQAAEAIAMLGDERIFPKIWATVISAYADDRVMGTKAFGALGTPKAKEVLITKLDDDVLEVRLTTAEQLGANGDTAGEPQVLEVFTAALTSKLAGEDLERARVLAALAIGRICTPRLRRNLPELLSDQSQVVRIAAAKAVFLCSPKPPAPEKPPI